MPYCEVIVDLASEQVDRVFTYRVPQGMDLVPGMRVRLPFGPRHIEGYVLSLKDHADLPDARLRDVERPLEDYPAILPALVDLAQWLKAQTHCTLAQALRLMIPAQMREGRVREKTQTLYCCTLEPQARVEALETLRRAPLRQRVLAYIAQHGPVTGAALREAIPGCGAALRPLIALKWVEANRQEVLRTPYGMPVDVPPDPVLTSPQAKALERMLPALAAGEGRFLLHGVTGSGKTEVFIRLVRACLAAGRSAIVLVPEIALTPQMVDWFRARFGPVAAVLHSRLSPGERYDEWRRVRRGDAQVVIGARSAVFAPLTNLGLIIVDEEHEGTYLSDHFPQYDARQVAQRRCEAEGGLLVLASATPSMRSFARARKGELELVEMPQRVLGRSLPEAHLVDMRQELAKGNHSVLSRDLVEAIRDCLRAGQQAILLMNRRGYATFVSCRGCGFVVKCPQCDVSMTYHQSGEAMVCHYCGHTALPPMICPACQSPHIRFFGAGTQKVEETVARLFPQARLLRMDNDTTRTKDAHETLLGAFRRGEADILIGTQMIAKGLDFPQVTLVGVVAADASLHYPDYRAAERTFQLVTQVAGRAGRAEKPGVVYVQTYDPEHYAIALAAKQDYRAFYEEEMARRRRMLYPPYTLLARLLAEGQGEEAVREAVTQAGAKLEALLKDKPGLQKQVLALRQSDAPIALLRGKRRAQLFVKLIDKDPAPEIVAALVALGQSPPDGVSFIVEINPNSMV